MNQKKYLSINEEHKASNSKVVLIVESDPIFIRVFSKILSKYSGLNNFSIKVSENTEEILLLAASGQIDAILMDVVLPNSIYQGKPTDGFSIARLLKSNSKIASIPVLLTGSYSIDYGKSFLASSGADVYIPLPILDRQAFVEIVTRYAFLEPEVGE